MKRFILLFLLVTVSCGSDDKKSSKKNSRFPFPDTTSNVGVPLTADPYDKLSGTYQVTRMEDAIQVTRIWEFSGVNFSNLVVKPDAVRFSRGVYQLNGNQLSRIIEEDTDDIGPFGYGVITYYSIENDTLNILQDGVFSKRPPITREEMNQVGKLNKVVLRFDESTEFKKQKQLFQEENPGTTLLIAVANITVMTVQEANLNLEPTTGQTQLDIYTRYHSLSGQGDVSIANATMFVKHIQFSGQWFFSEQCKIYSDTSPDLLKVRFVPKDDDSHLEYIWTKGAN